MSKYSVVLSVMAALLSALVLLGGCSDDKTPIRLGLVGGLSGENVDLGQAGRNGALLAVDEINQSGGVNGRPVELVIRDDKNRRDGAISATKDLVEEGVVAIVGPFTTTMAEAVRTVSEPKHILVFSPTASSVRLAGLDDSFFRLCSSTTDQASHYAELMVKQKGLRRISLVAAKDNLSFVKSWVDEYKRRIAAYGGELVAEVWYDFSTMSGFGDVVRDLLAPKPDAVMFVANAVSVARMAQQVRKSDKTTPIFASEWAGTQQIIELGGKAVNGLVVIHIFNKYGKEKPFLRFVKEYQSQFKSDPSFSSVIAYEVVKILASALEKKTPKESLKQAILKNGPYQGLQQSFAIDAYGDTVRQAHFVVVNGTQFSPVY
ncbi:MAG: ABC transporter substrate-binding protein [Desulfovibrio sp.]|uniref:ABC transporter substrate-binding protein n=1 Tax=Desulfovibrio sp. 7SRBS1 TaxID=3378064 RepID=UPI003B3E070D